MKRILLSVLCVAFCAALCLTVFLMPAATAPSNFTVTLYEGDNARELTDATAYTLPVSTPPEGKIFVGWRTVPSFPGHALPCLFPAGTVVAEGDDTTYYAVYIGMETRPEAEMRMTESDLGLRFITEFDKADLTLLRTLCAVSYGTLIAPSDYVYIARGVLSPEALASVGKTKYLDVAANTPYAESEDTETIAGSVVSILSYNRYLSFCAAGYLTVTYTGGAQTTFYASADADVHNCLYDLAVEAFCDRTEEADDTHVYQTEKGYSPYAAETLETFRQILDSVVKVAYVNDPKNKSAMIAQIYPESDVYSAPYTATYSESRGRFTLRVKDGLDYTFSEDMAVTVVNEAQWRTSKKPNSKCQIQSSGKVMTIQCSSGTPNY